MSELRPRHRCIQSWQSGAQEARLYRVAGRHGVVVTPHGAVTGLFMVQLVKFEEENNDELWHWTGLEHEYMTEEEVEKLLTELEAL